MSRLIQAIQYTSTSQNTSLNFERVESPPGGWGYMRYLTLGGRKAYELSFPCDTCQFIFERMDGTNYTDLVNELRGAFQEGIARLDDQLLQTIGQALPAGQYIACLEEVTPRLVRPYGKHDYFSEEQLDLWGPVMFWALPHFPRTEYYRTFTTGMEDRKAFFEFMVPMVPKEWLDWEVVEKYLDEINSGKSHTALAVSVLDTKAPAEWEGEPSITEHWCLAHFLLDGHHKTYAASQANKPLRLLSFLAVDESIAPRTEIDRAIEVLKGQGRQEYPNN